MANYRTSSLFHYTKRIKTILEILKTGALYPNYSLEDLSSDSYPDFKFGIPEVCLCDIPITMADLFLERYGKYAIAFSKQWGIKKGCNPVQYVSNERIIIGAAFRDEEMREINKSVTELLTIKGLAFNFDKFFKSLQRNDANMYALGFLKKYYGDDYQKGYINYNENEWRYIIEDDAINGVKWLQGEEEYLKWRGQNNYISKKTGKLVKVRKKPEPTQKMKAEALVFEPSDINHIIVFNESEIPDIIEGINGLKAIGEHVLDGAEKAILISKISSFERIKMDY